jgi:hypothetical protein
VAGAVAPQMAPAITAILTSKLRMTYPARRGSGSYNHNLPEARLVAQNQGMVKLAQEPANVQRVLSSRTSSRASKGLAFSP